MIAHNLYPQPTPFVGRTEELAEVAKLLGDPACRLLTLLGPGGIGKTRLALEVAGQLVTAPVGVASPLFPDGVYFAPLQSLSSPDFIVTAIAEALNFQFPPRAEPWEQLLHGLRERELLLLLDNFEHLLDGVGLIEDILACAPRVKVLATSRERLNLVEEWALEVRGLSVPPIDSTGDIEVYSAVQLFVTNARRVRVGFTLSAAEMPAVIRICHRVGGMPLGIEMAASWARALSCGEIADELERGLDILETSARNVPPRHRNMRAVLEQSWKLLPDAEREVFRKLSAFRGSFTRDAAQTVAGASLRILTALVDKSWLRRDDVTGRYTVHELLGQYGMEQLAVSPDEWERIHDAHSSYYLNLLRDAQADATLRSSWREAQATIEADIENVRAAWKWAVDRGEFRELDSSLEALRGFYRSLGWYREGVEIFRWSAERLRENDDQPEAERRRALALCLVSQAWFMVSLSEPEEAQALRQQSLSLLGASATEQDILNFHTMSLFGGWAVDDAERERLAKEALQIAMRDENSGWTAVCLVNLSKIVMDHGDVGEARRLAEDALAVCRDTHNRLDEAYALVTLSDIAVMERRYPEAWQLASEALAIVESSSVRTSRWWTNSSLGDIARLCGDFARAQQHYEAGLAVCREIGDRRASVYQLSGLASAAAWLGDHAAAREFVREALKTADEIRSIPAMLDAIGATAELMAAGGETARAAELRALVLSNPAGEGGTRLRAERLLQTLETELPPDEFAAALERGHTRDVKATTRELLADFGSALPTRAATPVPAARQALTDDLGEREREILGLIVAGLSNREIAAQLFLSLGTVKWYINQLYGKLGVDSRTRAIARARELSLLA